MTHDSGIRLKNHIALHRRLHGMTRTELGAKINRSTKNISMIEEGKTMPPLDMAWKIAKTFNVPINELFYEEGHEVVVTLQLVKSESSKK